MTRTLTSGLALAAALLATGGARAEEVFKLGFLGGLTGYLAPYDQPTMAGIEVAVDELNKAGGIAGKYRIELISRDMRSDTAQSTVMAQELVDAGITAMMAPCDVDPSIAAGQVAQAASIPVIASCASTPTLPATVGPFMFSNYAADNLQATALAEFAVAQGYKTAVVLLSPDTPYTQKLPEYFADVFEKLGGKVLEKAEYRMGQQDFSAEVTKISAMAEKPDVIMTSAYEPDFPAFIQQLRSAGVTTPVLGSDGIDSPTTMALGPVAEGVVFSNAGFATPGSPLEAFYTAYKSFHGEPTDTAFTATAYDSVLVFDAAVKTAGSLDGTAIRDAMDQIADLQVATGKITFKDRNRVPLRPVALNRVQNGTKVHVQDMTPKAELVPAP